MNVIDKTQCWPRGSDDYRAQTVGFYLFSHIQLVREALPMKDRFLALQKHRPHSLIIVSSRLPLYKQHDISYPYESGHVFRYLTRLNIHPCTLVLTHDGTLHAFLPPYDAHAWLWNGSQTDTEHASALCADHIHPLTSLEAWLLQHATDTQPWLTDAVTQNTLHSLTTLFQRQTLEDITPYVDSMRCIKDAFALEETCGAITASIESHRAIMRTISTDAYASALEGQFVHTGYALGYRELAYPPIVALGADATVLHYTLNTSRAQKDDWLLIDAGWQSPCGYASDITRSYPVNKKACGIRRDVYRCVLHAQKKIIATIKPGIRWPDVERKIRLMLLEGLQDLRIYNRPLTLEDIHTLFPHKLGHWLGLEVHEKLPYYDADSHPIRWTEGMLLTIEPGLYFAKNNTEAHSDLRGFGIRIEDNILVTSDGARNLTSELPVELDDIAQV